MEEGSFFCIVPRAPPWYSSLSFKKRQHSADKSVEDALDVVVERYSASLQDELATQHASLGHLPRLPREAHKFVYPSGGLVWRPGVSPVTSELFHVSPYVQQDAARGRVCIFFGYLSNLTSLQTYIASRSSTSSTGAGGAGSSSSYAIGLLSGGGSSYGGVGDISISGMHADQHSSARSSYDAILAGAYEGADRHAHSLPTGHGLVSARGLLESKLHWSSSHRGSAGRSSAVGGAVTAPVVRAAPGERAGLLTTSTLLQLYDMLGPGQEMLLLSELQGEYAFVIFDATKKQAFAARDPTGEEPLYMSLGAGSSAGGVMFTNSVADLPDELEKLAWQEVPPGHYVAGKQPALYQFALTMEQLQARERQESCTLDDALLFGDGGTPTTPTTTETEPGGSGLLHRLSRPWS